MNNMSSYYDNHLLHNYYNLDFFVLNFSDYNKRLDIPLSAYSDNILLDLFSELLTYKIKINIYMRKNFCAAFYGECIGAAFGKEV